MDVHACFGIRSNELPPDDITLLLGIQPTNAKIRGETYIGHIGKNTMSERKRPFNVWQVSSKDFVHSDDLQDHIDYLVYLLHPKQKIIKTLLANSELYIDVRFWVESCERIHSFSLNSDSITVLASLCRDFNVSILGGTQ